MRTHSALGWVVAALGIIGVAWVDAAEEPVAEEPAVAGADAEEPAAAAAEPETQVVTPEEIREINRRLAEADAKIRELQDELNRDEPDEAATDVDASVPNLAEEQAKLSQRQDELDEEMDGLRFVIPGTSGATVIFNGRIHLDYWGFPGADSATKTLEGENPQDRAGFRRIRFGAKGDIIPQMNYKVEIEFANPDDTEFRDVYIGFKKLPWVQQILFGNQKRPYGLDHLNSSRYNVFMERPMFIDAFNDDARRLGVAMYGVTDDEAWNWRLGVYNGTKIQDSDAMFKSDHYQGEIAGRIAGTPWYPEESEGRDYFHWALSGTCAFPDGNDPSENTARFRARPEARSDERWINTDFILEADTYELAGVEGVWNLGPFQLVSEYQSVFLQRDAGADLHFWGAYAYLSYFLTGEHVPWSRKSGTIGRVKPKENFFSVWTDDGTSWGPGAWQIAVRYSYSDMTYKDIKGGVGQNITAGLNWYWNPYSRIQFNYIHGWIDESGVLDAASQSRAEYDIVGARMMVDF